MKAYSVHMGQEIVLKGSGDLWMAVSCGTAEVKVTSLDMIDYESRKLW